VVPGPDLAVDAELADAPRDQLRVLRAEIEDEDLVAVDVLRRDSGFGIRQSSVSRVLSSPLAASVSPPGDAGSGKSESRIPNAESLDQLAR
jgi:hypothetical protein